MHDAQLLTRLLSELKGEQKALVEQDLASIDNMMHQRLTLLQQLSAAAKVRYDALAAQGYQADEQGMSDWIRQQSDSKLSKAWQIFQQSLAHAKELNRLNGILINKHAHRIQERLGAFQGNDKDAQVYGKNGQAKSQSYLRNPLTA